MPPGTAALVIWLLDPVGPSLDMGTWAVHGPHTRRQNEA